MSSGLTGGNSGDRMKKIVLVEALLLVLLAVVMTVLLWRTRTKDVSLSTLGTHLQEQFSFEGMEKAGSMRIKRNYGLNAADHPEILCYTPDNTMSVAELLIVKTADESVNEEVLRAVESRIATQKNNFLNYGTDQTFLLEHAQVFSLGNYVVFVCGTDAEAMATAIRKEITEGGLF